MLKIPRFMKEFSNYQIAELRQNVFLNDAEKAAAIERIEKAILYYQRGIVNERETMQAICNEY